MPTALDNPLWRYALELYACPGVQAAALSLQAAGASINRLLLACYLGTQGRELASELLCGAAAEWQQEITQPLRALRYRVRENRLGRGELDACYRRLREAELAAEQVELMLLWEQLEALSLSLATAGRALVRNNLQQVLAGAVPGSLEPYQSQLETLVGAAFFPTLRG